MELLDFLHKKRALLEALKGDPSGKHKGEIDYFKSIIDYHLESGDSFIADFRNTIDHLLEIGQDTDKNKADDLWEKFLEQKDFFYKLVLDDSFDKVMTDVNPSAVTNFVPIQNKCDNELAKVIKDELDKGSKIELIIENLIPQLKTLPEELIENDSDDIENTGENNIVEDKEDDLKELKNICKNVLMEIVVDGLKDKKINDDPIPYFDKLWDFLKKIPKGDDKKRIMEFDRSLSGHLLFRQIGFGWGWIKNVIDSIHRRQNREIPIDDDTISETQKNKYEKKISEACDVGEKLGDDLTYSWGLVYNDIIFFVLPESNRQQFEPWLLHQACLLRGKKNLLSGSEKKLILSCLTRDEKWRQGQQPNRDEKWRQGQQPNLFVTGRLLSQVKKWKEIEGIRTSFFIEEDILTRQKFKIFKKTLFCNSEIIGWNDSNLNSHVDNAVKNIYKLESIIEEYFSKKGMNNLPFIDFLHKRNLLKSNKNKNISLEKSFEKWIENPSHSVYLRIISNQCDGNVLRHFIDGHQDQFEMISNYFHLDSERKEDLQSRYPECSFYTDILDIPGLKQEVIGTFSKDGGEK